MITSLVSPRRGNQWGQTFEQFTALHEWMDFSLTEKEHREEILRAAHAELAGGPKTGLAPYEQDSVLCFNQLGSRSSDAK